MVTQASGLNSNFPTSPPTTPFSLFLLFLNVLVEQELKWFPILQSIAAAHSAFYSFKWLHEKFILFCRRVKKPIHLCLWKNSFCNYNKFRNQVQIIKTFIHIGIFIQLWISAIVLSTTLCVPNKTIINLRRHIEITIRLCLWKEEFWTMIYTSIRSILFVY